ncbi:MAG: hypothetical protein PWP21_1513 [Thermosediminibacterales bacterium]|nr:hypothetical protein [Thermosediminibacterales bacterium]
MMRNKKPTMSDWKDLYDAAMEFKKEKPWQWLYDADLICVQNPEDETIGYCSIMGRIGEHYALGVYLGDKGLYGFSKLMENADTILKTEMLHYQDCIMCSFENRQELTDADRKVIKELGLSFRGRNAWPRFRRFEPGYFPWYITQDECKFLTHALKQSLFVALNVRDGNLKIDMEKGRTILRYSTKEKLNWYSKKIELGIPTCLYKEVEINDDMLVYRLKKSKKHKNLILQVDTLYMPSPVRESNERPYYPRLYVVADAKSGSIMDYEMYKNTKDDADVSLNRMIGMFLNKGLPSEIHVRDERMAAILGDLCKKTGVKMRITNVLPAVDFFINEMDKNM